jgi:AraC-like DNA-binding protein
MHESELTPPPPKCLFAAEMRVAAGQTCFPHTHACTELVWYRNCAGWLPQSGERFRYRDGDVGIYQPGVRHGDECERAGVQVCVGVTGAGAERLPAGLWRPDPATRAAFAQVAHALGRRDGQREARLDLLCGWLALELRRQLADPETGSSREPIQVTRARRLFDTRFAEDLSVAGVAAGLAIHPDYLRQVFLKWTGEPPMRYLIRKRLEAACDLLRLNQESTARIAERVGIPNAFYFSRLFRGRFGCTPTQYRTRYASRTASAGDTEPNRPRA